MSNGKLSLEVRVTYNSARNRRILSFGAKDSESIEFFDLDYMKHVKRIRSYVTIDFEDHERLKIQLENPRVAANFFAALLKADLFHGRVRRWMRVAYELQVEKTSGTSASGGEGTEHDDAEHGVDHDDEETDRGD